MLLEVLDLIIRIAREILDLVVFALLLMAIVVVFEGAYSAHARAMRRRFRLHLGEIPTRNEDVKKAA